MCATRGKSNIRVFELAMLMALCIALCHGLIAAKQQAVLEDNIIRLHVIADSDDPRQQELKEQVRDRMLAILRPLLEKAETADEARAAVKSAIPKLTRAAELASGGQPVTVQFGPAAYPLRVSETLTLPAGQYSSLRVTIGSGSGHNWWGVVFPCFRELTEDNSSRVFSLIGEDNYSLISQSRGVEVRFHLLELFARMRELIG